jgi:hypothetical protein
LQTTIKQRSSKKGHEVIKYTVGRELHSASIKTMATVGEVKERLKKIHINAEQLTRSRNTPFYIPIHFVIHGLDELWETGEVVLRSIHDKNQVWEDLRSLRSLPDLSQITVIRDKLDISNRPRWPAGTITLQLKLFVVKWEVETPTGELAELGPQGRHQDTVWRKHGNCYITRIQDYTEAEHSTTEAYSAQV